MKLIYSELKKFLPDLKVMPQQLRDDLNLIGHFTNYYEKIGDELVFDLDIKVNRGDCLGYYGIARDLSVFYNLSINLEKFKLPKPIQKDILPIKIKAKDEVKRILAAKISGLKNKPSPGWLKKFLALHNVNSINAIVDLTNFIMFLYGIPCHAFDAEKTGDSLIWEINKGRYNHLTTFDGTKVKLKPETLTVSDSKEAVSLSVIGGKNSGVKLETKEIIAEMAIYDQVRVRKDAGELKIATEAATRLEKDLDTELIPQAFSHLVSLIVKNCGGGVTSEIFEVYNQKPKMTKILFDPQKPGVFAGINIPTKKVFTILKNIGCTVNGNFVLPPTLRKDINIEEDLIEEVIRFYGYNKIPTTKIPVTNPISSKKLPDITPKIIYLIKAVKEVLVNLGYDEIRSWPIIKEKYKVKNQNADKKAEFIYTQNNINADYPVLRMSIISSLVSQRRQYEKYKVPQPQFFEIGKVFNKLGTEYLEHYSLAIYHPSEAKLIKDVRFLWSKLGLLSSLPTITKINNDNFIEINLEKILEKANNFPEVKTYKEKSTAAEELKKQITSFDANVILSEKYEPEELIRQFTAKIGEKHLWQLVITDSYCKNGKYKYTFRAYYFNLDSKTAKKIHLSAFNLK